MLLIVMLYVHCMSCDYFGTDVYGQTNATMQSAEYHLHEVDQTEQFFISTQKLLKL